MIPQEAMEQARHAVWRAMLRGEQHRARHYPNRPLSPEEERIFRENIRDYWQSVFESKEEWTNGKSEESSQ